MYEKRIFLNNWQGKDESALKQAFALSDRDLSGVEILLASYTRINYCGEAFVLFLRDRILYEVNASHDSVDGFAGQWEPEDTLVEALQYRLNNGRLGHSETGDNLFANELRFLLAELERELR